jgi:hypothetical protein
MLQATLLGWQLARAEKNRGSRYISEDVHGRVKGQASNAEGASITHCLVGMSSEAEDGGPERARVCDTCTTLDVPCPRRCTLDVEYHLVVRAQKPLHASSHATNIDTHTLPVVVSLSAPVACT